MNVLLTTINSKYIHHNLAIGLLHALNKNHEGLSLREFDPKAGTAEIAGFCSAHNLVAFSCYLWNIAQTLEVAHKIKQVNPACLILLGGPEVSYNYDDIIALPEIDFIILGEGEIPFSALLKSYPALDQVPALVWKNHGKVIENPAPEMFNLQQLLDINPYLGIPTGELKHKICYIEASRGCPHCCDFCLAGLQNKVRNLPMQTIEANLLYLMENGRVIKFLDRTFNTHPAFAISIFQFILNHYKPGNIFQFEIKADILQEDFIAFIRLHVPKGVFRFEIGIQTLNPKSNHEVKRKQNFENIKTFIAATAGKVETHLDLIVGLPHDYASDIKYSFEEVFKLFAPELQLGFLKFLKGTPIRENYREHGYSFDPLPPYQIIESKYLSRAEIDEIALVEHTLDMYWNKKKALHTLKYVALTHSIYDFLHGLAIYRNETKVSQRDGLTDIYTSIHGFAMQQFPEDTILHELIALDYYLQHKVKPANRFLPEISKAEKIEITAKLNLNPHKYRYAMHTIHFSLQTLLTRGTIEPAIDQLIIEYTGTNWPRILVYNAN